MASKQNRILPARSFYIDSTDEQGLRLHISAKGSGEPVLFLHGATLYSHYYDLHFPGGSWMDRMSEAGFACYALEVRGYGRSQSKTMKCQNKPYAPASDAIKDIDDAINWISEQHEGTKPALVGTSWGSVTCASYASTIGAEKICSLALLAPIFAERNEYWINMIADPENSECFDPAWGAYRLVTVEKIRTMWDDEIPSGCDWRDDKVFDSLMSATIGADPESLNHEPPAFRSPNGSLLDLWSCFNGTPVYDPSKINVPVLLVRGQHDITSTRSDALNLFDKLTVDVRHYVEISNGGHFLLCERKAPQIFTVMSSFLSDI